MTKQSLTVLALIAATLVGCGSPMDPNYRGYDIDPQTRAALVSGLLANIGQNNAMMQQNPFAYTMRPAYTPNAMTCTAVPLGLIPSLTCR
jgi:hypothetical protein